MVRVRCCKMVISRCSNNNGDGDSDWVYFIVLFICLFMQLVYILLHGLHHTLELNLAWKFSFSACVSPSFIANLMPGEKDQA